MSKNYQIKLNQKQPSSEDIARRMDFDALLEQFEASQEEQKKPVRLRPARIRQLYYVGSAIAAAFVGLLLFWGIPSFSEQELTSTEYFQSQPYLHAPMEEAQPQFARYDFMANQGGVYEYESGSRLVVPASAFMNDRGEYIEGEIQLYYREMHDHVDFFLAGIPMTYDSASITYQMETAGMMEIYAEQNGERIQMAPNKSIAVELVSTINLPNLNAPPSYNVYRLDTASRNWIYQDVDRLQLLEEPLVQDEGPLKAIKDQLISDLATIEIEADKALAAIEASVPKPVAPIEPKVLNNDQPTFEVDLLEGILQEGQAELQTLQEQYGEIIWQLTPNNPDYDARAFDIVWQNAKLLKRSDLDYQLTLIHGTKEVNLNIVPVLSGEDFDRARANYESDLQAYEQALRDWENLLAAQKEALAAETEAKKKSAQEDYMEKMRSLLAERPEISEDQQMIKRRIVNRFKASGLGIWSCDRLIMPTTDLKASFKDQNGQTINQSVAYLVDKSKNTVYRFYINSDTKIPFNPNSKNLMWILTEDHKLAMYPPEDFKRINQQKGSHTFQMKMIDQVVATEDDLRKHLEF